MKRFCILGFMVIVSTTIFAQQFFIEGHIASDFESITPNIGIGVTLSPIDIMAGSNFRITGDMYEYESDFSDYNFENPSNSFGFYIGVAPKANITEKMYISFPILLQARFWGEETKYAKSNVSVDAGDLKKNDTYNILAIIGARVNYSFTTHWIAFAGFGFNIFSYGEYKNEYYLSTSQSGGTYLRTEKYSNWFNDGNINLGICYKF